MDYPNETNVISKVFISARERQKKKKREKQRVGSEKRTSSELLTLKMEEKSQSRGIQVAWRISKKEQSL